MAECLSNANVILPEGDVIHRSGRYSLVNCVQGGQTSLVNNVQETLFAGDVIHSHTNNITGRLYNCHLLRLEWEGLAMPDHLCMSCEQ